MNEITLTLDRDDRRTLTEQLYAFLKAEIMQGNLAKNEKVPSKRKLSSHLKCSINTIQGAYNQLVDEGYLVAKEKSGYFVAELDGILDLAAIPKKVVEDTPLSKGYRYDFSYHGVDLEQFPFRIWRRITREVINEDDKDLLVLGNPKGLLPLRSSIARYLHQSRGVVCSPHQIIVSSGTEFLLQLLIQLLDPSTIYAIENPGYEKLNLLFKRNRVNFKSLPLDEQGLRPERLEQEMVDVVCVTPSHQFPTGCIMPVKRRLQLLAWASEQAGRYIVEDDYDSEFRYSGKPIPSLQGMDQAGRVIYLGAFSKSLSPSLRISYMVLPEKLIDSFDDTLSFYNCPVPTIAQKTLKEFMDKGHFERHLNRMRNLYGQKREALVTAIQRHLPFAEIEGASAGLHVTVRINNGMDEKALVASAESQQIKVYGLSRYYSECLQGGDDGRLLLGFATMKIENMEDAVALLAKGWC
ncbi:transcriptional regulator with HTH domain and aminotransferase domain [Sphaerochaeta pleomorpha str. Grapes]|uniref:Transcriptional regulator with HTH domain and aminotransferase domain n=1 Tax=Sphaerochaeta pleomorpha (strain ATCC BAA-1885 / DSM 22778 / Grapes) TaxID=158190 RepID=G8QYY9_SPHPG|nr:PLP-dependent aminotransferase family protein [Sphaerochaeta pleomorpha]AEV30848.1 transcriptional regulator with HTH domain and aminotransferase domain [Sphaerochaeta pleomorpha str. Grapes]